MGAFLRLFFQNRRTPRRPPSDAFSEAQKTLFLHPLGLKVAHVRGCAQKKGFPFSTRLFALGAAGSHSWRRFSEAQKFVNVLHRNHLAQACSSPCGFVGSVHVGCPLGASAAAAPAPAAARGTTSVVPRFGSSYSVNAFLWAPKHFRFVLKMMMEYLVPSFIGSLQCKVLKASILCHL